jgi:serine/threonine-protein kinase
MVIGPDGSVYFAADGRVRKVGLDGIIHTVAGGGATFVGEGVPATSVSVRGEDIAVGPDGSLYLAERSIRRVRRVGPDGLIRTIAGTGEAAFAGDGGPATQAKFADLTGIALGPDGGVYIVDSSRIRHIGTDGIIRTVVGTGANSSTGDGGPAIAATVFRPDDIAVHAQIECH